MEGVVYVTKEFEEGRTERRRKSAQQEKGRNSPALLPNSITTMSDTTAIPVFLALPLSSGWSRLLYASFFFLPCLFTPNSNSETYLDKNSLAPPFLDPSTLPTYQTVALRYLLDKIY